ncbi:FAD-binding protein [Pelagovum pacificum]|uniref:FAD-binding oxidoreductase n=1 Tax=Pelagovum pacificum TaxID=2588711 RepID=A0A5C5GD74_9RHOB|nr:FAD-binding oxidoreductase [Pelagovum pacificum]QQA44119.1 FAD-binding oxidoreductase [Pelagovum pacificum]TNY32752.1 FAD-binding oxidoreductase [Pelagovum pacificum]
MRWKEMDYAGWGRALSAHGHVARPERSRDLKPLSLEGPAMGNRRSYGDAALNGGGRITDMTRLDRILSFDETTGILEAEAGIMLGELAEVFAPRGWLPPVMPGTGFATLGGAIAMDVHGKNHHGAGSFGAHVTEVTLVGPAGEQAVTPEDLPLFRATLGGLGQTGIIARAKIAMKRCKGDIMMVTERRAKDWDDHIALLDGSEATYVVGWIDATATGAALGRGIVEEGETGPGLVPKPKPSRKVPFDAPGFALAPPIVKGFNELYYRRVPKSGRTVVRPIGKFFFPLDKVHDWNRLYGKRGFHQFQCVVPLAAVGVLRDMLEKIAASGLASPLAVLKRMGAGRAGHMSFPMEGYTLAVDFPNRDKAVALIGELEAMTEAAGGRLYLAKDSLADGARIKAMYPEHADWLEQVRARDPDGLYLTDMVRRLDLRSDA